MAQPTLKSLPGKRNEITAWLQSWAATNSPSFAVEHNQNNVLFETVASTYPGSYPIQLDDETVGYVKDNANAPIIAPPLSLLLHVLDFTKFQNIIYGEQFYKNSLLLSFPDDLHLQSSECTTGH